MNIEINLSKKNRRTLVKLCLRLFSDFKKIKISKRTVILKRRWYSLANISVQVVDLVLLQIPHLINELYEEYELEPIFDHSDDLGTAVEYFTGECDDIIQHLQYQIDNLDISMELEENFVAEPRLLQNEEPVEFEESYATRKVFKESIEYFYNLITSVMDEIPRNLEVVYRRTESACNSPPIRAPGYAA